MNRFMILVILQTSFAFTGLFSQNYQVKGRVSDSLTGVPLAFVNIIINDGRHGGVSDIDGRFSLTSDAPVKSLRFSYVGYKPVFIEVSASNLNIIMSPENLQLPEVLIEAGENPAHRIIRNAVANRKKNNPANIPSYTFTSYDKMVFSVNADSLKKDISLHADSSDIRLLNTIEKQHLFVMESVSEHSYTAPGRSFDNVIATRISGLKDPLFLFLISQLQSTSFYDEAINIAGLNYVNPISPNSWNHYFFSLRDTIYANNQSDTTFIIEYKPRKGKNFDGLKGLVYISSNGWAISNVIAEPAKASEMLGIKIQQLYELIDGKQWFPVQLNTEITFKNINVNRTQPTGYGKSYRRNIQLNNPEIKKAPANLSAFIVPEAASRNEDFWAKYRIDSLDLREKNTYRIIDSLGRANHLDKKVKGLHALTSGRLPIGYLEIDLNRIMRYNKHEGFYVGIGLWSSDKLSGFFKAGGYWGYGFKDKQAKYGASLKLKLNRYGNFDLALDYSYDVTESAGTKFFDDQAGSFNYNNFRNLYVEQMDLTESYSAAVIFRMLSFVKTGAGISSENKKPLYDYAFAQASEGLSVLTQRHQYGKFFVGMKFAWGEKFIRDAYNQVSTGTRYPVVWLQYTRSEPGFLGGEFVNNRWDFKMRATASFRFIGKSNIWITASSVDGKVPMQELINGRGGSGNEFSLYAPFSFVTMKPGEFLNDKFAAVFFTHTFRKLMISEGNFEPEPGFVMNAGIGSLKNRNVHRNAELKTMEKGYFESGIIMNNMLSSQISSLGIGVFYRGGAYSNQNLGKNFYLKITMGFNL